jgi:YggT family protein
MGSSQVTEIVRGVGLLIQLLGFAIFARAILSWFPIDRSGPVVQALEAVTDPILQPLRRVIPPLGMIDITPMVAMIVLLVIGSALSNY